MCLPCLFYIFPHSLHDFPLLSPQHLPTLSTTSLHPLPLQMTPQRYNYFYIYANIPLFFHTSLNVQP